MYAYVGNDPINATDPSGQYSFNQFKRDAATTGRLAAKGARNLGRAARATGRFVRNEVIGDRTVYVSVEASVTVGVIGFEGEVGVGFDGKTGEGFAFQNSTDSNIPVDEQPVAAGLNAGVNANLGIVQDSSDLTSPTLNISGDVPGGSLSAKVDPETGELRGVEVGVGVGAGASASVTQGSEIGERICLEESKCGGG